MKPLRERHVGRPHGPCHTAWAFVNGFRCNGQTVKLHRCHQLFFPTQESLSRYLSAGCQVQDLRQPDLAYRRIARSFQVRDLRARCVQWKLCRFELPTDMRYLQPLGDAPDDQQELGPVRINFTPPGLERRSYGPITDWLSERCTVRWWASRLMSLAKELVV